MSTGVLAGANIAKIHRNSYAGLAWRNVGNSAPLHRVRPGSQITCLTYIGQLSSRENYGHAAAEHVVNGLRDGFIGDMEHVDPCPMLQRRACHNPGCVSAGIS